MTNNCEPCSASPSAERELGGFVRRTGLAIGIPFIAAASLFSAGCTTPGAKPWEHDLLAERAMQVDPYPLETRVDAHIYFSKEASSGGRSFAGGGCGCN